MCTMHSSFIECLSTNFTQAWIWVYMGKLPIDSLSSFTDSYIHTMNLSYFHPPSFPPSSPGTLCNKPSSCTDVFLCVWSTEFSKSCLPENRWEIMRCDTTNSLIFLLPTFIFFTSLLVNFLTNINVKVFVSHAYHEYLMILFIPI